MECSLNGTFYFSLFERGVSWFQSFSAVEFWLVTTLLLYARSGSSWTTIVLPQKSAFKTWWHITMLSYKDDALSKVYLEEMSMC